MDKLQQVNAIAWGSYLKAGDERAGDAAGPSPGAGATRTHSERHSGGGGGADKDAGILEPLLPGGADVEAGQGHNEAEAAEEAHLLKSEQVGGRAGTLQLWL